MSDKYWTTTVTFLGQGIAESAPDRAILIVSISVKKGDRNDARHRAQLILNDVEAMITTLTKPPEYEESPLKDVSGGLAAKERSGRTDAPAVAYAVSRCFVGPLIMRVDDGYHVGSVGITAWFDNMQALRDICGQLSALESVSYSVKYAVSSAAERWLQAKATRKAFDITATKAQALSASMDATSVSKGIKMGRKETQELASGWVSKSNMGNGMLEGMPSLSLEPDMFRYEVRLNVQYVYSQQ